MTACPLDPTTHVPITEGALIGIAVSVAFAARAELRLVEPAPECWCPGGQPGERCRTRKGRAVPDHKGRAR